MCKQKYARKKKGEIGKFFFSHISVRIERKEESYIIQINRCSQVSSIGYP